MLGEEIFKWLVIVSTGALTAYGMDITYEDYAKFPKLFQLDQYEECLGPKDGLYCVGAFHLKPLLESDPIYNLMQEYSEDTDNFNRTLIHRGYCVSSRCPSLSHIHNTTQRFERCIAQDVKRRSLNATLTEFSYCRTHSENRNQKNISADTPKIIFLYILLIVLAFNVIGTVYDVMKKDDHNKSKIITSWSVKSNWPQLVGPYPDGDPRLAVINPVQAFRTMMMLLVILTHVTCVQNALYLADPTQIEKRLRHWSATLIKNGSSMMQAMLMLSSFLFAHSVLESNKVTFKTLLHHFGKRIFRIMPVYLLGIGFAATYWPSLSDGPLWHSVVDTESQVCRRKFWTQVFFVNNIFEPKKYCQSQTWFLAVDMQLYILGSIIILCMERVRKYAVPILGIGFILSAILNGLLAYIYNHRPLMYLSNPENMRNMYLNEPSFHIFYTNPVASLPALTGALFCAYLQQYLNEIGFKVQEHKWLIYSCQMTLPLLLSFPHCLAYLSHGYNSRIFHGLYAAVERPVPQFLCSILFFGTYHGMTKKHLKTTGYAPNSNGHGTHLSQLSTKGLLNKMFSSRFWYPLARSSLAVLMLHWVVNVTLKAPTLQPITTNSLDTASDTITTAVFTYMLALPVTLLIDIPFTMLYSAITSRQKQE